MRAGDAAIQFKAAAGDLMKVVDDLDCYYPQLITVGETVVRLAGNATEYLLVVALRHVIATEVDQATRAIIAHQAPISVKGAVARDAEIAHAWEDTARHVRAHRVKAAR